MVLSTLRNASLGLVALLSSCSISPDVAPKRERLLPPPVEKYEWSMGSFASYNPPVTSDLIPLEKRFARYVLHGFDADLEIFFHRERGISNVMASRENLFNLAAKVGYAPEYVKSCSVKEAMELTCKILAHEKDYFGRSQDFETKSKRDAYLDVMENTFSRMHKEFDKDVGKKKNAAAGLVIVGYLRTAWDKVDEFENLLTELGSETTNHVGYDRLKNNDFFNTRMGFVCRQFATAASDLALVIRTVNPNLRNTYVSEVEGNKHRWNQVTTLSRTDNTIRVDTSFFDPTAFDGIGKIEGYTTRHFNNFLLVRSQLERAEKASNAPLKKDLAKK